MADLTPEQAARVFEGLGSMMDQPPLDDGQLAELGHAALTLVLLRTKTGLDADRKPFAPYAEGYAQERIAHGLAASPVDLVRTGHMLGSFVPEVGVDGAGTVTVRSNSEHEAVKATAHNQGVDKMVPVRRRSGYTGKAPYTSTRKRTVRTSQRHMRLPKREVWDIRAPEELEALGEMAGGAFAENVAKRLKQRG